MVYTGNVFTNLLEGFSMLYGSISDSLHLVKHRIRDLGLWPIFILIKSL